MMKVLPSIDGKIDPKIMPADRRPTKMESPGPGYAWASPDMKSVRRHAMPERAMEGIADELCPDGNLMNTCFITRHTSFRLVICGAS